MKTKLFYTLLFIFFFISTCIISCAQDTAKHFPFFIGDSVITISKTNYKNKQPFQLVQLHHDEITAGEVAKKFSNEFEIDYLQIINNEERLINFNLNTAAYRFDPNRIFSNEGIAATLKRHSQYSDEAFSLIDSFSKMLLGHLDSTRTIVAMHNNTDGGFALINYIPDSAGLFHFNPLLDADDFFITTDSTIFEKLKEKNFNVVWEWADKLTDDGSLSIYCSRNKIRYVNIEAEYEHVEEQALMLRVLIEILKEKTK